MRIKPRVHEILEVGQNGDRLSKSVDAALMALIVANVAAIIVATDPRVHGPAGGFFHYFELASFSVFAVEYLLRVWSCTADARYAHPLYGRLRYIFHPLMLADATAVFSYFVIMLLPTGLDLGALRTLRLMSRLISLARYSAGMQAVVSVASARKSELLAVISVVGALLVMASSLMYLVEHAAQPEKFSSIPHTMWWSVITVTTVGYGDVAPVTPLGRLLAGFIALLGVAIFRPACGDPRLRVHGARTASPLPVRRHLPGMRREKQRRRPFTTTPFRLRRCGRTRAGAPQGQVLPPPQPGRRPRVLPHPGLRASAFLQTLCFRMRRS